MVEHKRKPGRPILESAIHRRIAAQLRARMAAGEWPKGSNLPARRTLAKVYDVGETTVRLALFQLRGEGWVGKSPRNRWFVRGEAPVGPGGLGGPAVDAPIAVVIGQNLDDFLASQEHRALLRGIEREAGATKSTLTILQHDAYQQHIPPNLDGLNARGLLLLGTFRYKAMRRYQMLHWPMAIVNRPGLHWKVHAIRGDNIDGSRDATRRLLELGHRRIAFVRLLQMQLREVDAPSRQRLTGFREAFQAAGLEAPSAWYFNATPYDKPESPSIQALFNAKLAFTAVVAADAPRALLVKRAAEARGLRIPRDLSLITFQGVEPEVPEFSGPRVDFERLGREAVRLLSVPRRFRQRAMVPMAWAEGATIAPPRVTL